MNHVSAQEKTVDQLLKEGKGLLSKRTSDADKIDQALDIFKSALTIKNDSAKVHASLSEAYSLMVGYAKMDVTDGLSLAKFHGTKAYTLDKNDLYVLKIWLRIMLYIDLDIKKAKKVAKRILKQSPNDIITHWKFVEFALYDEKLPKAQKMINTLTIDFPESATDGRLAWHLYLLGDFKKSYMHAKNILEDDAHHEGGHFHLSRSAAQLGLFDEALQSLTQIGANTNSENLARHSEYIAYTALAGNKKKARALLEKMLQSPRINEIFDYKLAQIYAALGENDTCVKRLEKAIKERETFILQIKRDPMFKNIPRDALPTLK